MIWEYVFNVNVTVECPQGILKVGKEWKKKTFLGYAFVCGQIHNTRKVAMESKIGQVINLGGLYQRFE